MNCNLTDKDKAKIAAAKIQLIDINVLYSEKINIINELQSEIGSDENPSTIFQDAKIQFQKLNTVYIQDFSVEINQNEEKYGLKHNDGKPVFSSLLLDGQKYTAIQSENQIRIFKNNTNNNIANVKVSNNTIEERNQATLKVIDRIESIRFKDEVKYPLENRNLGYRIVNTVKNKYKMAKDGAVNIGRKIIQAKDIAGVFGSVFEPFSSLKELRKSSTEEYNKRLGEIIDYIPKSVSDIILNKKSEGTQEAFIADMEYFNDMFENLSVPKEEVWIANFELNENGELVQKNKSKYVAPNYLEYLGEYKTRTRTREDGTKVKYQQLVLDPAIDEIVKFYAIKTMSDMDTMASESLAMDDAKIAKDFNIQPSEVSKIKEMLAEGIVPISSVINDVSKDAFDQIGISINANMSMDIKDGIIASMASLIKATIRNSKYVEHVNSKNTIEAKKKAANKKIYSDNKVVANYKDAPKYVQDQINEAQNIINNEYKFEGKNLSFYKLNIDAFENTKEIKKHQKVFGVMNKLQYLSLNKTRNTPKLEPISEYSNVMLRTNYGQTTVVQDFIRVQQKIKWNFKNDMKSLNDDYNKYYVSKDGKVNPERIVFLQSLGYEVVEQGVQHISKVKKIQANNDKLIRELETLMSYYESPLKDGFYLPWNQTSNGRASISSDMNPQESKFMRSYIEQEPSIGSTKKGHSYEMEGSDFIGKDNKVMNMLEMAISQAFDMDPDKMSKKTVLRDIRAIVDVTGDTIEIATGNDFGRALNELVKNYDNLSFDQIAGYQNIVFGKGEGYHGLQAVRTLRALNTWKENGSKGKFLNDLTIETDAITSGMMITLMQVLDDNALELLAKGGIYTSETLDKWTKYTQKWLKIKQKIENNDDVKLEDVPFGPSSLIEAGNFHQQVVDNDMIKVYGKDEKVAAQNAVFGATKGNDIKFKEDHIDQEVFHDLYKTIGIEMEATVNNKKNELNEELALVSSNIANMELELKNNTLDGYVREEMTNLAKDLRNEEQNLKVMTTMFDVIGTMTPKVLRAIAKDPTMVYIYGSTIKSIKKLLATTIGKKYFISSIEKLNEYHKHKDDITKKANDKEYAKGLTKDEGEAFNKEVRALNEVNKEIEKAEAFVQAVLTIKNKGKDVFTTSRFIGATEDGNIVTIPSKKLNQIDYNNINRKEYYENLMQLDIDDDYFKVLQNATNETFGDAIEEAFTKKVGNVDSYRDKIKSMELIIFEFFRARTETYKARMMKKDGVITRKGFDDMLDAIRDEGNGHDTKDSRLKKGPNLLPLMKFAPGIGGEQGSVTISFDKDAFTDKEKNTQQRIATYLNNKNFVSNTGAAPTTTTHWGDSQLITVTISENAWLSVYDAVVQASHPDNVKHVTDTYNTLMIEDNINKDLLGDNLNKLNNMYNGLIKRMNTGSEESKLEAKKEYDSIVRRLSSVEKAKVEIYSYTSNRDVYGSKPLVQAIQRTKAKSFNLDVDGNTHIGTLSKNMNMFVDVKKETRTSGDIVIEEVYWDKERSDSKTYDKNNIKKIIQKTVVKLIRDGNMHVIEKHRKTRRFKDKNFNEQTNKVYHSEVVEFEVQYDISKDEVTDNGTNKIEALNDYSNTEDVNIEGLEVEYNKLKDGTLKNIISIEPEYNVVRDPKGKYTHTLDGELKKTNGRKQTENEYVPSMHGLDYKKESNRLSKSLDTIGKDIDGVNETRQTRMKNSKQELNSAHMANSDTETVSVKDQEIKLEDINTEKLLGFLNKVSNENRVDEYEYITNEFKVVEAGSELDKIKPLIDESLKISKENEVSVEVVGTKQTNESSVPFEKINKHNSGSYDENSIITIMPTLDKNEHSMTMKGKLTSNFNDIDVGISYSSDFIAEPENKIINEIMNAFGLPHTLNYKIVQNAVKKLGDKAIQNDVNLNRYISNFVLNNYLKNKGYLSEVQGSQVIWKQIDIRYNELSKLLEEGLC